jgi:hypothetical protein
MDTSDVERQGQKSEGVPATTDCGNGIYQRSMHGMRVPQKVVQ